MGQDRSVYLRERFGPTAPKLASAEAAAAADSSRVARLLRVLGPGYELVADAAIGETAGICVPPKQDLRETLGVAPKKEPAAATEASSPQPSQPQRSNSFTRRRDENSPKWPGCLVWHKSQKNGVLTLTDLIAMSVAKGFTAQEGKALFESLDEVPNI